jgi:hypothetical protein
VLKSTPNSVIICPIGRKAEHEKDTPLKLDLASYTELAPLVCDLMGDRPLRAVAGTDKSGVSRGALHQIMVGVTTKPTPDTLENLARFLGASDEERRAIYAAMMRVCGYLDFLPASVIAEAEFQEL